MQLILDHCPDSYRETTIRYIVINTTNSFGTRGMTFLHLRRYETLKKD